MLRDAQTLAGVPQDDDWFITDSFEFLGRAVGTSARAAKALFSDLSLGGQVNLLTTGAFDNPLQLLQLDARAASRSSRSARRWDRTATGTCAPR